MQERDPFGSTKDRCLYTKNNYNIDIKIINHFKKQTILLLLYQHYFIHTYIILNQSCKFRSLIRSKNM